MTTERRLRDIERVVSYMRRGVTGCKHRNGIPRLMVKHDTNLNSYFFGSFESSAGGDAGGPASPPAAASAALTDLLPEQPSPFPSPFPVVVRREEVRDVSVTDGAAS